MNSLGVSTVRLINSEVNATARNKINIIERSLSFLSDCRFAFFIKKEIIKIGKIISLRMRLRPRTSSLENSPNTGRNMIVIKPKRGR